MGRKPSVSGGIVKEKPPPKKRGRKPKGGKIIKNIDCNNKQNNVIKTNVILHLKHLNNTTAAYDPEPDYLNFRESQKNTTVNDIILSDNTKRSTKISLDNSIDNSPHVIWDKIRRLKISLHKNDIGDKTSCCFWCTYDFDNPPIYIPKQKLKNGSVEVYGCFCRPECAVAYLKRESLDTSVLWERYSLLNNIYSSIYNYEKNIQPAPSPFYTLDKYYGTLSIDEYRSLFNKQHFLIVVDKPLTKLMPELYEEVTDEPNIYTNLLTQKTDEGLRLSRKSNSGSICVF